MMLGLDFTVILKKALLITVFTRVLYAPPFYVFILAKKSAYYTRANTVNIDRVLKDHEK